MTGRRGRFRVRAGAIALAAGVLLEPLGGGLAPARAQGQQGSAPAQAWWSAPSGLAAGCGLSGAPRIAFPSDAPTLPSGPGVIAWVTEPARCGLAPGASIAIATLGPGEQPGPARMTALGGAATGPLLAVGASEGGAAVAVGVHSASGSEAAMLLAPRTPGSVPGLARVGRGLPLTLARAYLGDCAIANAEDRAIAVRTERHYETRFEAPRTVAIGRGAISSLAVAMDFRSDVLLAWQQNGSVYAHLLRASGVADPTQRLGSSAPSPQLQAAVSDNGHGMVAWSSTSSAAGPPSRTRIQLALSGAGVRFGSPRTLAAFADPGRVGAREGSIELVRLSGENVLLAWTQLTDGHYGVLGAPAVFAGTRPATPLSDPRGQAVLDDLAAGPAGEAVALVSSARAPAGDPLAPRTQLWAQRVFFEPGDRVGSLAPEEVAAPGAGAPASVAVDPASDRALAAWRSPAGAGAIEYAVSHGAVGYRPRAVPAGAVAPAARRGEHWLRIAGGAALAGIVLGSAALRRRARARRAGS